MDQRDREVLRRLAGRWMELASLPVMAERKRQWTALHDLRPERPMVLFEIWYIENYVADRELECQAPELRNLERRMRWTIRQAEEIGDDVVVEPRWPVHWHIQQSDYGVSLELERAQDVTGGEVGYHFNHPIRTPDDIDRLKPRTIAVDRAATHRWQEELQACFGDILPVVLMGTGSPFGSLTQDLFKLIGNQNLLTWPYDAPEALHRMMAYLRDDRLAYFNWMEREGLLALNNAGETVGGGCPGATTALPQAGYAGAARLRDLWVWIESQETRMLSPAMFKEFFLPYMADVARLFGLVYYGCCEPVHDRWDLVAPAMPNVRCVSISPWADRRMMGEKLGRKYVFSRKSPPWLVSEENPDWDVIAKDIDETVSAARDGCLEFIFRDVYRISSRAVLKKWVDLVRARIS